MMYLFIQRRLEQIAERNVFESVLEKIVQWISTEGLKILLVLVALFFIYKLINQLSKTLKKTLEKRHVDKTIEMVILSATRKGLKLIILAIFLDYLGFETSSLAALIASIGVGLGLALQGALANLAGGIIILVMRPFKIDDFIETNGQIGTVEDIRIFYTLIVTPDNKVVLIPNGTIANNVIINYSKKDTRRLDLVFTISYDEDLDKAKRVIYEVIKDQGMILEVPKPFINIKAHGNNSIELLTRVWCKADDYWDINFALLELVKKGFDKNNITIPYQQIDVHFADSKNDFK